MLLPLLLLPFLAASVSARFVNVTIDDTHGDARTGQTPSYSPEGRWNAVCPGCGAVEVPLNWTQVEQRTIHDAIVNSTIGRANVALSFNGSAIYVFFAILPMFSMQLEFYVDSSPRPAETYIWLANATATDVLYDHLVFKSGSLDDAEHTLLISCAYEGRVGGTIALFDYALYTVEDADAVQQTPLQTSGPHRAEAHSPSAAEKGIICAAVVGAAAFLAVVAGYLLRRRHRARASNAAVAEGMPGGLSPFPGPATQRQSAPEPKDSKRFYRDAIFPFRAGSSRPRSPARRKASRSVPSEDPEDASAASAVGASSSSDSAYLRAELERMHTENEMLRQVSEPPPYDLRVELPYGEDLRVREPDQ